jgi:bifunctional non-homologous end joining protein LigD
MSLTEYKRKRNFRKTSEPAGRHHKKTKKLEFVIQKHHASHLHYDFRLELGGVLISWAVPKGPSLNSKDRRLAMKVEDHPYDYRTFEGEIPKGNYGAGNVIVWDRGTYEPAKKTSDAEKELRAGLHKGHLSFILHGDKLQGEYALVKSDKLEENAWLLMKKKDDFADNIDITLQNQSVITGKTLPDESTKKSVPDTAEKSSMPTKVKPMLATLTEEAFDDSDWLYEIKWDGYRAIGSWDGKQAALYSRNGNDFSRKYPSVHEELKKLKHKAVIDGEIVAVDEKGKSRFEWLQNYQKNIKGELIYYVFDLLWLDGYDIRDQPLVKRKELLEKLVNESTVLRYSDHVSKQGKSFFEEASQAGLEGIMAKHSQSIYKDNYRSKQWLKIKTHMRQEVVIGGFTEPRGSRKHIGALIVGVYDNDELKYVGHTGGGIPTDQLPTLRKKLEGLERQSSPFEGNVKPNSPVHWVTPKLVCEVTFAEWTSEGRMRQPIFTGMRVDKSAKNVTKELPEPLKPQQPERAKRASKVRFSHLDKVFWPEAGYTKGDLIDYYSTISTHMLPYIISRPQSLLRHPSGYKGPSFFQKDFDGKAPDWVKTKTIYSESNDKNIEYLVCNSEDSLLYMAQLGCIEINPWSSRINGLHKPDWVVIDLDPEAIAFKKVVEVALEVKKLCDELNVPCYPKTSGKTGMHIFIPLNAKYTYNQVKTFGEILANLVHERVPKITSVERSPKKRQGKIYLDYLQNREGQTLAAPYSVRPTKEASVSTPLDWDEVTTKLKPPQFTIANMPKRLAEVGDLWKPVLETGIDLKKVLASIN